MVILAKVFPMFISYASQPTTIINLLYWTDLLPTSGLQVNVRQGFASYFERVLSHSVSTTMLCICNLHFLSVKALPLKNQPQQASQNHTLLWDNCNWLTRWSIVPSHIEYFLEPSYCRCGQCLCGHPCQLFFYILRSHGNDSRVR